MTWLKYFIPAFRILAEIMRLMVSRRQRRFGRLEADNAQAVQDQKMQRKAANARRSVRDDAEGVRGDPRNRDAR